MSGIVFMRTGAIDEIRDFYTGILGCEMWLDQEDCIILRHGNLLIGFCERDSADDRGMITLFYDRKEEVDLIYSEIKGIAVSSPRMNEQYRIYQFFAKDPEGRDLEFQYFDHHIAEFRMGGDLLCTRRSIRKFRDDEVPEGTISRILELCRFAPTSMNTQSYYFRFIKDRDTIEKLSRVRGDSSSPIRNAPLAVAVCSDPALSKRHIQDGCIAAYHFVLACWFHGLGTCWIAAMDRSEVKDLLGIPEEHYIATVTPIGFPVSGHKQAPERKDSTWFVR